MSKNVKVSIRIRAGDDGVWRSSGNTIYAMHRDKQVSYTGFSSVFEGATNAAVYEQCVRDEVQKFLNDENCTVFAYGQTGSGKTHTMLGETEEGIIKLAVREVLSSRAVGVSYLEIYNEKLFDLASNSEVQMFSVGDKNVISKLCVENVSRWEEVLVFIERCERNRRYGTTEFNAKSSRSHTVFQVTYRSKDKTRTLNMIDLAGSERASRSSDRRREGAFINKSLLALCTVIDNIGNGRYTGFRESKLTRILQPSLDGDTNLVAICMLSPFPRCMEESISTLKFAARMCSLELKTAELPPLPVEPKRVCRCHVSRDELRIEECAGEGLSGSNILTDKSMSLNVLLRIAGHEYDHAEAGPADCELVDVSVLRPFEKIETDAVNELGERIRVLEQVRVMNESRICMLEKMVTQLLCRNPSRKMNEIFILEKHMFNLRRAMVGRK